MQYGVRQSVVTCVVGLACALLGSCGWTDMISSKRNPAYSGPELKRLMVMGASADSRVRRVFEDEFVAKLKAAGIAAQPSYAVLPEFSPVDRAQLQKAAEAAGVDGILAARLVAAEPADPNALEVYNFEDRSTSFYGVYASATGLSGSFSPGLSLGDQSTSITIHFDLYSVANSQLVWAGDAATVPSSDVKELADELASTVIRVLKGQKLI